MALSRSRFISRFSRPFLVQPAFELVLGFSILCWYWLVGWLVIRGWSMQPLICSTSVNSDESSLPASQHADLDDMMITWRRYRASAWKYFWQLVNLSRDTSWPCSIVNQLIGKWPRLFNSVPTNTEWFNVELNSTDCLQGYAGEHKKWEKTRGY